MYFYLCLKQVHVFVLIFIILLRQVFVFLRILWRLFDQFIPEISICVCICICIWDSYLCLCLYLYLWLYLCLRQLIVFVFVFVFEAGICVCEKLMEVVRPIRTWDRYWTWIGCCRRVYTGNGNKKKHSGQECFWNFYNIWHSYINPCKGWLAIAKLKPLSLFIPLVKVVLA